MDRQWKRDGTVYRWDFDGGIVWLAIQDEGGKIDLNQGRDNHLKELFRRVGLGSGQVESLVDAIADFRDEDHLHRLHGAEDEDYEAAGLIHGAKDAPFEAVEELGQVMGVTTELYDQVSPFLTVYSKRPKVDLITAPREVLLAVPGSGDSEVDDLLAERAEMAGPIPTKLLALPSLERGMFSPSGAKMPFTVRAEAHTKTGAVFVREAVVEVKIGAIPPVRVLQWRQGKMVVLESRAPAE